MKQFALSVCCLILVFIDRAHRPEKPGPKRDFPTQVSQTNLPPAVASIGFRARF